MFHIEFAEYVQYFKETYATMDDTKWYSSSFLKLNDSTIPTGSCPHCGAKCTRHELAITNQSTLAQLVYLTAHTWDQRCIANSCEEW